MRSGRLFHRVSVQKRKDGQNDFGERDFEFQTIGTRRAAIEPLAGREYFSAMGENSKVTTRIRIRCDSILSQLATDDRIVHGEDQYNIESVLKPLQRGGELVIMASLSNDNNKS